MIACTAIAGVAGVAFGLNVNHLVAESHWIQRPAAVALADGAYRQEVCLFRAIRSAVPRGAPVYVNSANVSHTQRLAELSTLWAVPQEHRAAAEYELSIKYLGKHPPPRYRHGLTYTRCAGAILLVRHK